MENICFLASKGTRLSPHIEFPPVLVVFHIRAHEHYVTTVGPLCRLNLQIFRCLPSLVIPECPHLR